MLMISHYFSQNMFRSKRSECFNFYHLLILLSRDAYSNPGPNEYFPDNDNKLEIFYKRGLRFLHINVNSLLSKIVN